MSYIDQEEEHYECPTYSYATNSYRNFLKHGLEHTANYIKSPSTNLSDPQFRSLLDLFMCSDPWPISDQGTGDGHKTIESLLDIEAKSRGYIDWVGAYHEFKPEGGTP